MDDDALPDDKTQVLRRQGTLNPRPNSVRDPLFAPEGGFFDRRDIVQVKYEMLRKARVDGETITYAAAELGLSRVAFYNALIAFEDNGLAGLLPHKRGPRQGHKLTDEVIDFLRAALAADASLDAAALSKLVRKRFRRSVHPRSIERAMVKKNAAERTWPDTAALHQSSISEAYESLRDQRGASSRWGSVVLMRRGMLAWMCACSARLAAPSHSPGVASAGSVSPPRLAVSLKREVTDIVANMVIAAAMVSR